MNQGFCAIAFFMFVVSVLGAGCRAPSQDKQTGSPMMFPLRVAVRADDLREVSQLLAAGADPNETVRGHTWTAIGDALSNKGGNREAIALLLIAYGADVNTVQFAGVTPLQLACSHSPIGMVQSLLNAGADAHIVAPNGSTLLHIAAGRGSGDQSTSLLGILIEHGVDVFARDTTGRTAADIARKWRWEEGAAFLDAVMKNRADVNPNQTPVTCLRTMYQPL